MSVVGKLGAGAVVAGVVAAIRAQRGTGPSRAADPEAAVAPTPADAAEPADAPEPVTAPGLAVKEDAPAVAGEDDRVDLNAADFEQLRRLNLSVTLANRIIAIRDAKGGFSSPGDLDEIRGLSASARTDLRKRFRV